MNSHNETGHARNVANFRVLIEHCATLGTAYNPGNPAISLTALQTKLTEAEQALSVHLSVKATYDSVTNTREILFKELQVLTTRIMGSLVSFDVEPLTLADAKSVVRKLRGQRAAKKAAQEPAPETSVQNPPPETPATVRTVSASQRSYDQQLQHYARLLQLLQTAPAYTPNEVDLTVAALQAYQNKLAQATAQVATHTAAYTASVRQRNEVLYLEHTGLPALALAVKAYIKSVYGQGSPEYKSVRRIRVRTDAKA